MPPLYVSATGKGVVSRLGTGTLLGAERTGPKVVQFDTDRIVQLTDREVAQHGKHYRACLQDGSLRKRTVDEWDKQVAVEQPKPEPKPEPKPDRKPVKFAEPVLSDPGESAIDKKRKAAKAEETA